MFLEIRKAFPHQFKRRFDEKYSEFIMVTDRVIHNRYQR